LNYIFPRKYKILFFLSLFILFWIIVISIASNVIISKVPDNINEIIIKKNQERTNITLKEFDNTKNSLSETTKLIIDNLDFKKALEKGDLRKLFDVLNSFNLENKSIEVFDKRMESIFFSGKQIPSEILLIQKALSGNTSELIKDVGFFTYLINYTPIRDALDENKITGVLLSAILIDSKYSEYQFELVSKVLSTDLSDRFNTTVKVESYNSNLIKPQYDSSLVSVELSSFDKKLIGYISFQSYDLNNHIENIIALANKIRAVLTFLFSIFLFPIVLRLINLFKSPLTKIILFLISLLLVRYLWISAGFPSYLTNSEIFNPMYYASKFGNGMLKSLGELLVTVHFLLIFTLFVVYSSFSKFFNNGAQKEKIISLVIKNILLIPLFFFLFYAFGTALRSLIYDSNIIFLDKSNILPDLPLFIIQLSILFIAFSYLTLHSVIIIYFLNSIRNVISSKIFKRFYIIITYLVFLLINQILNFLEIDFKLYNLYRVLIISIIFLFAFYILKSSTLKRNYNIFSIRNFSLLLLQCIIITPIIILDITKSQETTIIENIGIELAEDQSEKIIFLISEELGKINDNKDIEQFIKEDTKIPKLAYYLWSSSKFSFEKFKSDLIILDTNKKIISDFNSSNNLINSDTIVSYLKRNFFNKKVNLDSFDNMDSLSFSSDENQYEEDVSELADQINFNEISILDNKLNNFFVGILPIEKKTFKNTQFSEKLGYIIITINSESFSLFSENKFTGNFDIQGERLFERLITKPVITEFNNGEIINSSDMDVSKSVSKYLDLFKESVKNTDKNYGWRYDQLVNERYRTLYIIKENENVKENRNERIFAVSAKRDDFGLLMFYFLKFVLFAITVFLGFYLLYALSYLYNIKAIQFYFKEKLLASFILVSVIPIVFLAIYTRTYINNKNDLNYKNQLLSDLNLLNETLKDEKVLFNKYKSDDTIKQAANEILKRNFENSNKNYNIFVKNKLISTTNEELYKSDFLDSRISNDGYYNIVIFKKDLYLHTKNIQGQNYLVGYKPLKDRNGFINGIISSFSVYKQKEIQEELTETLTFIFGSYFIVIVILLLLVSIIVNKISEPILLLKEATDKVAQGNEGFQLKISRRDEVGSLVESFNKMTKDLQKSNEKLKKAEREAAWRDIARRVAHEIKNPLTPMKLSIQHLYNLYLENDVEEYGKVLKKTKDLIINEIDKLNKIASAFYDFAKLPKRNYESVNINEILDDVISLYSLDDKVEFVRKLDTKVPKILADKQELNRIFQNLIKNSIQSFRDNGKIILKTYDSESGVIFEIIDNGCGIESDIANKLFEPNFSTKTTGMGLGLAITKKSLDDMKAKIFISSKLNEGTTVKIEFKKL